MATRTYEKIGNQYIGRYKRGTDPEIDTICDQVGEITHWLYKVVRHRKRKESKIKGKKSRKRIEWYEVNDVFYISDEPVLVGLSIQSEDTPEDLAVDWEMRSEAFKSKILTFDDDEGRFL